MYMCVCVYVYIYMYIYVCIRIYIYIHININIYVLVLDFWFLVCYAATKLATPLHQRRIQVVRRNKVVRNLVFISFFF